MAKISTDDLLEQFKEMTLIELSEFVKQFEDTFGVTAAAPMGYAPGPGTGPAEPAPVVDVPTSFDAILTAIGDKKINVIKVVREVTSLGLKEAKDLVETPNAKIKEGINMDDAKALQAKFEGEGAKIEIKPAG